MKVKVKKVTVKMILFSQNELKQAIVSQSKEQLGETRDRITLSMPATKCGLLFWSDFEEEEFYGFS